MHRLTRYSAVTLLGLLSCASVAAAEDWPTWRHDAGRTNVSAEKITDPLRLQWKRQLPPVTPAFRKSRLQFDQGYEPIVLGDTMYVALPHIDAVVAYAVETGKEKWRFYTAGPVRLAPVAWRAIRKARSLASLPVQVNITVDKGSAKVLVRLSA